MDDEHIIPEIPKPQDFTMPLRKRIEKLMSNAKEEMNSIVQESDKHFVMEADFSTRPAKDWEDFIIHFHTDHRFISRYQFSETVYVSTVFLGLDHWLNFDDDPDYQPVLFETMVFGTGNETTMRYCTYEEAIKGHEEQVKIIAMEFGE